MTQARRKNRPSPKKQAVVNSLAAARELLIEKGVLPRVPARRLRLDQKAVEQRTRIALRDAFEDTAKTFARTASSGELGLLMAILDQRAGKSVLENLNALLGC